MDPAARPEHFLAHPEHVLAHPTRGRLYRLVAELERPVRTDELAALLGLHPNGVRVQLGHLHAAGLLTRERIRHGRGRPRDHWSLVPEPGAAGEPPTGYAELAGWLARTISGARLSRRRIEAAGRAIGLGLTSSGRGSPEQRLRAVLVAMGFAPERETEPAGTVVYRLCNCPYRESVRESPDVVCTLHRGITRGLLDGIAPETKLAAFVPRDPDRAGCLIRLRGGLAVR